MVPGLRVESVTVARGRFELRVHRVTGAPPGARVEQTGWATGPDEALYSGLHPLHGWLERDEVRAPQGTAYTPWAVMPRLTAPARGTCAYAALAVLSGEPDTALEADAVAAVTVDDGGFDVRWADDGSLTRITFDPVAVTCRAVHQP
jgi:hypothetical protein